MKTVNTYIQSKQNEFQQHPFFNYLDKMTEIDEFNGFVKSLAFWPMAFQDILRINEARMTDKYLHKVARHHRMEDAGHERWYLSDMNHLDTSVQTNSNSFDALFDRKRTKTRDASYAILSEVFKLTDDRLRVILLLTLESSGHIFFEKTAAKVRQTDISEDSQLKYFSTHHLEVELAHAVFEESMEKELFSIVLPEDVRREALHLIDRVYDAFNLMFDGLVESINEYEKAKAKNDEKALIAKNDEKLKDKHDGQFVEIQ